MLVLQMLVVCLLAALLYAVARANGGLPWSRQNRKVRMYLQGGATADGGSVDALTIEGVLAGRTRREYIIWAPRLVTGEGTEPVEVSGHVEIPRERVQWYQVIG
jgi:hypothetical protein